MAMPKKSPLPAPLTHAEMHLMRAALGWLELGNPAEARAEMEKIAKKFNTNPNVVLIWCDISAAQGNWDDCLKGALKVTKMLPSCLDGWIHLANATRHTGKDGIKKAEKILSSIYLKFHFCPAISYTRALCAGQRGDYEMAAEWLDDAFTCATQKADVIDEFAAKAMKAPELKPIWDKIQRIADFNKTH